MKRILAALLLLALACTLAGCGNAKKRADTVLVQIDSGQVSYLEANCFLGPRIVRMEDDPGLVLALITIFLGVCGKSSTLTLFRSY